MSKRKNLHKYVQTVQAWNRVLGMDIYGDWNEDTARRKAEEDPASAMEALAAAVAECVEGFKVNPSCPALDTAINLIGEGRIAGLPPANLDAMEAATHKAWGRERAAQA